MIKWRLKVKKIFGIMIFILFIACNNSKSKEIKQSENVNEKMAVIQTIPKNEKSCEE